LQKLRQVAEDVVSQRAALAMDDEQARLVALGRGLLSDQVMGKLVIEQDIGHARKPAGESASLRDVILHARRLACGLLDYLNAFSQSLKLFSCFSKVLAGAVNLM